MRFIMGGQILPRIGFVCYILNDNGHLAKFDFKSDRGIFLGYFLNNHAYRVFNLHSKCIHESVNVYMNNIEDYLDTEILSLRNHPYILK